MEPRLAFITRDHHLVRDFVVREMPQQSRSISPQQIALVTGLDLPKVSAVLKDLERHLFFLVRDSKANVSWAFPVTILCSCWDHDYIGRHCETVELN